MCGRVQMTLGSREAAAAFVAKVDCDPGLFRRHNAAPSQSLPLLVQESDGGRTLVAAAWGFPLGPAPAPRPINARSETVATRAAFRTSFRHHRAALPVTGFYEWQAPDPDAAPPLFGGPAEAASRQPWLIEAADGGPFALAALTVRDASAREEAPASAKPPGFCVLTTTPNAGMARIHDRMPVVLGPAGLALWLDPATKPERLDTLLAPVPASELRFTAITRRINRPAHEGPSSVQPQGPAVAGATFAG